MKFVLDLRITVDDGQVKVEQFGGQEHEHDAIFIPTHAYLAADADEDEEDGCSWYHLGNRCGLSKEDIVHE